MTIASWLLDIILETIKRRPYFYPHLDNNPYNIKDIVVNYLT